MVTLKTENPLNLSQTNNIKDRSWCIWIWQTGAIELTNCGTKSLSSNQMIKYSSTAEMVDWTENRNDN